MLRTTAQTVLQRSPAARAPALLLAALLIAVAALLAPAARPAEAQSPIWSATLTVGGTTTSPGCGNASECATALTDNTFVYDGTEYTVETLSVTGGTSVLMVVDSNLPDSLDNARLQVGRVQISNGVHAHSSITWTAITTLSWTAGSRVQVRLLPPPPDDWRSWNPTLTVADTGSANGCSAASTPCSSALTDDTFVFDDGSYTITGISQTAGNVRFTFAPQLILPSSLLRPFKMRIDSVEEPLAGHIATTTINLTISGLNWSVGDRVRLRLIPGPPAAPTGLSLAPGSRADTLAAAWTAPDDSLTARVTGYEVRYKALYAPNTAATVTGNPNTGWVTKRVGTTPRATLAVQWDNRELTGAVRALSAAGASPWSTAARGTPKDPPGGPAATPLRLLSASRTSVTEGDAPITITARLAQPAPTGGVVITISHEQMHGKTPPSGLYLAKLATACDDPNNAEKDYTFAPAAITIAEGQRTGQATLTVCDDNVEDTNEYIYLHPEWVPNEAYPISGSGVYQITSLRITILNDETGTGGNGGTGESASPPPNQYHSDPYLAELQRRIVACAQSPAMKTAIDNYVNGTGTDAEIAAARASTPACQYN